MSNKHLKTAKQILFLLLSILPSLVNGMERKRQGYVMDEAQQPVEGAVVSFLSMPDSVVTDVAITDTFGFYSLSIGTHGNGVVIVDGFSYKRYITNLSLLPDTLYLKEDAQQLGEVVIKGKRISIKRVAGKFVFSPGTLCKEVDNGYELLKYAPLVEVTDNVMTILGKGTSAIYLNGRDPKMSSSAVMDMLRTIPADRIKKVEVLTAPGSSHSASMSGGIANIILEQPDQGVTGNTVVSTRYLAGRVSPVASVWLGYVHRKFSSSGTLSYQGVNQYSKQRNVYEYTDWNKRIENQTRTSGWMDYLYGHLNMAYTFSEKMIAGIAINANATHANNSLLVNTIEETDNESNRIYSQIESRQPFSRPNYGMSAYYSWTTDSRGSKLDVDANYYSSRAKNHTDYRLGNVETFQTTAVKSSGMQAKIEYFFVSHSGQEFSGGSDYFKSRLDNNFDYYEQSNRFAYDEAVSSGFLQWKSDWNDAISTNIGMRIEHTDIHGRLRETSESFRHRYTDFFPSVSLSIDFPKGDQNISLDWERVIYRPFYNNLNPFRMWTSDNTYSAGNPRLRADYSWETSLYYSFLNDFVLGVSYSYGKDCMTEYTFMEDGITVSSYTNTGDEKETSAFFSYNNTLGKLGRFKLETSIYHTQRRAFINGYDLGFKSWLWSLALQHHLTLSSKQRVKLATSYRLSSPYKAVTRNGKWKNILGFSISKAFGNNLNISLDGFNLLNYKNDNHYSSKAYRYRSYSDYSAASFTFKLTYRFGKKQVSGAKDKSQTKLEQRFRRE